jgi:hypothetical protein
MKIKIRLVIFTLFCCAFSVAGKGISRFFHNSDPESAKWRVTGKNIRDDSAKKTGVIFKTSDIKLQKLFDEAEKKAKQNLREFGKYKILIEGGGYNGVWLETQPMGGFMYAKRDLVVAENNIRIFMDYQREDGRFPGMIVFTNNKLIPEYGWFQGFCFPGPAYETYFWLNKDQKYLQQLYGSLERFDDYLWKTRDSDNDGCLESWCVYDTGEDNSTRYGASPGSWPLTYPPSKEVLNKMTAKEVKEFYKYQAIKYDTSLVLPVPVESMDVMSYSYSCRDFLAKISNQLGTGRESYWRNKADDVRRKIKDYLWDEKSHACYDRDNLNKTINILIHNNLRCLYYGSFDQHMADDFIKYHLMNRNEFWTPMPLPSIAVNDPYFRNNNENDWSGQPEGLTFQRSISALENYGHFAELTMVGTKFLNVVSDSLKFTQQFDPFKAIITQPWKQDSYGPSILTSLEFISRLFGVHITQDKIFWSCLDKNNDYSYTQYRAGKSYEMKTSGHLVICSINGEKVFLFTKGARIVSDLNGKPEEVVGIETEDKNVKLESGGKKYSLKVAPNSVFSIDETGRFRNTKTVEFCKPFN